MPSWHVVGLFESTRSVKSANFGFVCVWARIKGPYPNKLWADTANSEVTDATTIRYGEAKWKCVYSTVVSEFDLRDFGLQNGEQVNGQLSLPGLREAL